MGRHLTITPTILAFAIPDKQDIMPTLYHLRGAGLGRVIFPVPWRAGRSGLERTAPWVEQARALGLDVILDIGPWLDVALPAWGVPDSILSAPAREHTEGLIRWWREVRAALRPSGVMVRRRPPRHRGDVRPREWPDWERTLSVWQNVHVEDVTEMPHLDVRDLEWQEWESDREWWEHVDNLNATAVWVQPWWVEPGRQATLPTPEVVHEGLGSAFAQVLLVSLLARGVTRVIWHPLRGGIAFGRVPVWGWGTSLDGGAPLRPWGEVTPTWLAVRRLAHQARALSLPGDATFTSSFPVEGDVNVLAYGSHEGGRTLFLRRLSPGEVEVSWPVPSLRANVHTRLTGPGAWMFPLEYPLLDEQGSLLTTTGDVVWRDVEGGGERWVVDVTRGMEWVQRLPGRLVYETGAQVRREDDIWWVHFDPGQQGQVVWEAGSRRVQVIAVDEPMAHRIWATGMVDTLPLFLGPDRVLDVARNEAPPHEFTMRVSVTQPRGLVVVDTRPWQLRVEETGKTSVWGRRAGMGGLRLAGPKEWGAPRVATPDLTWQTMPWDGPLAPGRWEEISPPRGVALPPGWHWFQAFVPPNMESIVVNARGVCDVWLGPHRVAGIRSPDKARRRIVHLPERNDVQPLTLLVWVLPPAWDAEDGDAGMLDVGANDTLRWRYRAGMRGLVRDQGGDIIFKDEGHAEQEGAIYLHRADFTLEVPSGVWVQFGLSMGEIGELAWVFLNGHLVGQWWAGRSREVALWLPWDVLDARGANRLCVLHWPRGQEAEIVPGTLVQLCRERVSTVHGLVLTTSSSQRKL